jgi:UDP-N-acetylglucosamine--N-acetylmuramyl-(pentapeptide) pyrophosphoryl-undecaprenol N-acetylglucosamine transferase
MAKAFIVLTAGGTGGHLFPAQAVGEILIQKGYPVILVTDPRGVSFKGHLETKVLNLPHYTQRVGLFKKINLGLHIILKTIEVAFWLLKKKPGIVVGFGGYPAFPTLVAAVLTRTPLFLYEQNAYLGRVNRWLAPFSKAIATGFSETEAVPHKIKVIVTGNPVRPAIKNLSKSPYKAPGKSGPLNLFVVGGSQGAKIFSTLLPDALNLLPPSLKRRLRIVQQCRPELVELTKNLYSNLGIFAEVKAFFDNIGDHFKKAHLVICRSGASTLTELMVIGRPALFVPFFYAMDDHQTFNARVVVNEGGGWMISEKDLTAPLLAKEIEKFLVSPKSLEKAAKKIHDLANVLADQRLADAIITQLKE